MEQLDSYLNYLDETFGFKIKAFKIDRLKKMTDDLKKNVKGKSVNMSTVKRLMRPIPVLSQEKINKFLAKYIPNYMANYNTANKHFKRKYPTGKKIDTISGATALMASMDNNVSIQDQIRKSDKIYSKFNKQMVDEKILVTEDLADVGANIGLFLIGFTILFTLYNFSLFEIGTTFWVAILGAWLMLASILNITS